MLFVLPLGIVAGGIAIVDVNAIVTVGALASLVLLLVATGIVMTPRVALTPAHGLFYIVPVIDAAAIVALRLENPLATTGALLVLIIPAVWLGTSGRVATVALAGALATIAVSPDIADLVTDGTAVSSGDISDRHGAHRHDVGRSLRLRPRQ